MNSLFARVFISFWIVLGIIIAGCVATTTMVAWRRISVLSEINFAEMNKDANAMLRAGGEAGLQSWLREEEERYPGVDIYVLNKAGRDLLDRRIPPRLSEWLARGNGQSLIAGGPDNSPLNPSVQYSASHLLDSSQIRAANGQNYTLAVAWFGSSPIDVLGSYNIIPGLLALALLVSLGASWWLARYISAPIHELQRSARVLARGDLDAKVDRRFTERSDEIGTLAREFNNMASQLKSQVEAKEVLLRDISHELRSPLARIQVALGLASLDQADIKTQHRRIERDIERMNGLIEEIIRLAKLTDAPQAFAMEDVELGSLVEDVVDDASTEARAAGCHIVLAKAPDLHICGNAELFRRAVENILRNAIRFSPDQAEIEIAAHQADGLITLEIRDHGPGVPESDLQRIFDPFFRVSSARERDSGGFGLGLAITARITSLHGGTVRAQNHPEQGLIVTLTTPATTGRNPARDTPHDALIW